MIITKLLSGRRFFLYYKDFALIADKSHTAGVFLAHLVNLYDLFQSQGKLYEGKWFFATGESIESETFISVRHQRRITEKFEKMGVIKTRLIKLTDAPRKYFTIDHDALEAAIEKADMTNRLGQAVPVEGDQMSETYKVLEKNKDKKNKEYISDSGESHPKRSFDFVDKIIDHWNSKENLQNCRGTEKQKELIKRHIKRHRYKHDEIIAMIDNYHSVLTEESSYYKHKFNLPDFISRESSYQKFHEDNFLRESFVKFPSGGGTATPMRELTIDMLPDPEPEPGWDYEGMKIIEDAYYGRE
jgi:hypothetical protein